MMRLLAGWLCRLKKETNFRLGKIGYYHTFT